MSAGAKSYQRVLVDQLEERGFHVRIVGPEQRLDTWTAVVLSRGDRRDLVAAPSRTAALEAALRGKGARA